MNARAFLFPALLTVALAGCTSDPESPVATAPDPNAGVGAGGGSGLGSGGVDDPTSLEYFSVVVGDRVFFATDRFDLDADAQAILRRQAEWFRANPGATATIEGHADERGTRTYNLALGARRANAALNFLVANGVPRARLNSVTFGKERPVSLCSFERCWSQNRRSVAVVIKGPVS
ncbi:MAG: OmpA family protein [Pseudomonadota bacterium]